MFHESPKSHGNALFIILITVALFAALSYVVAQSFRGGTTTISDEQARVAANTLLRDLDAIKTGFNYLWIEKGCSMDDIKFGHPVAAPYDCAIFHPLGAGVSYPSNLESYQDNPSSQVGEFYMITPWRWTNGGSPGDYYVVDLATPAQEIMIHFNFVNEAICRNVNKALNYGFTLSTTVDDGAIIGDEDTFFVGKSAGCRTTSGPLQIFYVIEAF